MPTNRRTIDKATIRRASAKARSQMGRLDRAMEQDLNNIYKAAQHDLEASIKSYGDENDNLRLEVLRDMLRQVNDRLTTLSTDRDNLLNQNLKNAAQLGVIPIATIDAIAMPKVAEEAVRFVQTFTAADGLRLSDRLWRVDNQAKDLVSKAVESAVIQGHSAAQAAKAFLANGEKVPKLLRDQLAKNSTNKISRSASQALTGKGSPMYNALRVMRTEINRAHGEAYMAGAEEHPDVIGFRFLLSPRHPAADICDLHATANLHGLGPGVYPTRSKNPWPAHPNTLSFVEVVFKDEISEEDKNTKEDALSWLKKQQPHVQIGVLGGVKKQRALLKGVLQKNEIATPWNILKKRYEKRGIDLSKKVEYKIETKRAEAIDFGTASNFLTRFGNQAFAQAPKEVQGVINKVRNLNKFEVKSRINGSFYNPSIARIVMKDTQLEPVRGFHSRYSTLRHEYGHHIDTWSLSPGDRRTARNASITLEAEGGFYEPLKKARLFLEARSPERQANINRLRKEAHPLFAKDVTLADLFGALTNNRVGFGHSKSYYKTYGMRETEAFANLFDIYSRRDRAAWQFVEKELPDLAKAFTKWLQGVAK